MDVRVSERPACGRPPGGRLRRRRLAPVGRAGRQEHGLRRQGAADHLRRRGADRRESRGGHGHHQGPQVGRAAGYPELRQPGHQRRQGDRRHQRLVPERPPAEEDRRRDGAVPRRADRQAAMAAGGAEVHHRQPSVQLRRHAAGDLRLGHHRGRPCLPVDQPRRGRLPRSERPGRRKRRALHRRGPVHGRAGQAAGEAR